MNITPQPIIKQNAPQKTFIFRLTLAACLIFWIFVFVDSGWGPDLTPLSIQLHTPLSIAGLFYVIWSTGYLPGALVGGAMLDRYGPRRVLFIAALIILCGMLLILLGVSAVSWKPFAPYVSVAALLVVAGLAGIGGGVIDATTNGLISSLYAHKRGSALNMFNLLYPLGGVCIALIDAGLLTLFHNDPRPPLVFTICFTIVAMISLTGIPRRYLLEAQTDPIAEDNGRAASIPIAASHPRPHYHRNDADLRHQFQHARLDARLSARRLRPNPRHRRRP